MTDPAPDSNDTPTEPAVQHDAPASTSNFAPPAALNAAPTERGWGRLLLALAAFVLAPMLPQVRALLPIDQTVVLFVPAVAACALVGWWAGGRAFLAIAWMAIAVLLTAQATSGAMDPDAAAFYNLARGWSLLLAGAFGLVCLFAEERPMFSRALLTVGVTLVLAGIMSMLGPVTLSHAAGAVSAEYARRNAETMATLNGFIKSHPQEWQQLTAKIPELTQLTTETEKELGLISEFGYAVFPALLALESLAALALAWATYHRLGRARLGAPLRPLREFRFNDQLVWGLIVGLTVMLLPTLTALRGTGKNLLLFFGALYAMRGFGVLSWFMAPGSLGITVGLGFLMLFAPVVNAIAALVFMLLGVAALALGLGDTWADWRRRARPSP
ncbi:MAG: DUF2232 domain-containing protein [Gemmatimonadales bacterium]